MDPRIDESETKQCIEKSTNKLVVFEDSQIRRIFHQGEWYFSRVSCDRRFSAALNPSPGQLLRLFGYTNPRRYWPELKKQLIDNEGFAQLLGKIEQHEECELEESFEIPLKRPGKPMDQASAALYLASDESSWMTGQIMTVDGGQSLSF